MKEEKSKDVIMGHSDNNQVSEAIENKKVTTKTPEMPKSQKSTIPKKSMIQLKKHQSPKKKTQSNSQSDRKGQK